MSTPESTEELVSLLAKQPPPAHLSPAFPVLPLFVCLVSGLFVRFTLGDSHWAWGGLSSVSQLMVLKGIVEALIGLWLCLVLASPTGTVGWQFIIGASFVLFVAESTAIQAQSVSMGQFIACYALIVVVAVPSLVTSIWVLRRGATLFPAILGSVAGIFTGGSTSVVLLPNLSVIPNGSGNHPQVAAMATLGLIGAFAGKKLLKW